MAEKLPKTKELRAMPKNELEEQLRTLRQALWQQRVKAKDGALQQTSQLGAIRHQIARIHTVLKEQV